MKSKRKKVRNFAAVQFPPVTVAARLARLAGKAGPNFDTVQLALKVAALTELPEAAMEREVISEVWDEIHALRVKGISFRQIAALLKERGCSISHQDLETSYREIVCEQ